MRFESTPLYLRTTPPGHCRPAIAFPSPDQSSVILISPTGCWKVYLRVIMDESCFVGERIEMVVRRSAIQRPAANKSYLFREL